jgi:hypothetical protein
VSERQAWSSEVLDFLTVRTRAIFADITPQSAPKLAALLLKTDWEAILVGNLLSSPAFVYDIEEITWRAPRELRRTQTSNRSRITHGLVRGRVQSRRTLIERIRRQDPTLWVIDPRQHVFQTASNGALVGFLDHILRVAPHLTGSSGRGLPVSRGIAAVDRLIRTWPLNEVQPDPAWASVPLPPDLLKVPTYALAWRWATRLSRARHRRDTEDLRPALAGWLAEETDERLFELYALSRSVAVLHDCSVWEGMTISLSDLSVIAWGAEAHTTILIDQTPRHAGQYNWLLSRYDGIDGRGRRPDLQLITNTSSVTRTTFVEAKETYPNGTYGRDSLVKVLGYLKDYQQLWAGEPVTYPRAVLLYSEALRPKIPLADRLHDEVLLSSPATFDDDLAGVLGAHLA